MGGGSAKGTEGSAGDRSGSGALNRSAKYSAKSGARSRTMSEKPDVFLAPLDLGARKTSDVRPTTCSSKTYRPACLT